MTTADIVGIIIAVVLIAAFAGGAFRIMAGRRALRERFGDEYDNVVRETGSRAAAESELRRRTRAHKELALKEIPEADRARYRDMWTAAQARFVDDPAAAVRDADRIVAELVAERGYPVVDFSDRVAHLSVEHTGVLADYRAGHEIAVRNDAGRASTEELRQSLVHYRAVYAEVLGDSMPAHAASTDDESGIAPVPGEGGDVNALAQSPLTGDSDEVAIYAPADPVPPAERIRMATDEADPDAADPDGAGTDIASADAARAGRASADAAGTDRADTDTASADAARTDLAGTDAARTDLAGTDADEAIDERDSADRRAADERDSAGYQTTDEAADARDSAGYQPDEEVVPAPKKAAKRRVNGARLGTSPTTEVTDATSDAR